MPLDNPLKRLQKAIHYSFNNEELLKQALTHRSADSEHNERLEFLGDAILGAIIAHELFQRLPKADEGQLSRLRAYLVKEKALFEMAQKLELGDYLYLGGGELKSGGFRRASILSDAYEAMIAAVYLDSDFETVRQFVLKLYSDKLSGLSLDMAKKDPKTRLQEWLQARNIDTPEYKIVRSSGKEHAKIYWVACHINHYDINIEGQGTSRRKAEQAAAGLVLEKLQNVK